VFTFYLSHNWQLNILKIRNIWIYAHSKLFCKNNVCLINVFITIKIQQLSRIFITFLSTIIWFILFSFHWNKTFRWSRRIRIVSVLFFHASFNHWHFLYIKSYFFSLFVKCNTDLFVNERLIWGLLTRGNWNYFHRVFCIIWCVDQKPV
jgi:hypothetical protein